MGGGGFAAGRPRRAGAAAGGRRWEPTRRDHARAPRSTGHGRRFIPALLLGGLLAALGLAALRVEVIRQRYALAEVMQEEKRLLEERAALIARMRSLRDPARLARLAGELELARPERVVDLATPAVAAGPRP